MFQKASYDRAGQRQRRGRGVRVNEQERNIGRERREEETEGREETIQKKKPFYFITQPAYVISNVPAEKSGKEDKPKKRGVKPNK